MHSVETESDSGSHGPPWEPIPWLQKQNRYAFPRWSMGTRNALRILRGLANLTSIPFVVTYAPGFEIAIWGSLPQSNSLLWERRLRRDFEADSVKHQ